MPLPTVYRIEKLITAKAPKSYVEAIIIIQLSLIILNCQLFTFAVI
jgi:hypothetical protein